MAIHVWSMCRCHYSLLYSMKTSFTKWKPDPEGAASEYEKAGECCTYFLDIWLKMSWISETYVLALSGTCVHFRLFLILISSYLFQGVAFKNGKALEKAKGAYELAADCQMQCKQLFHAAKWVTDSNWWCASIVTIIWESLESISISVIIAVLWEFLFCWCDMFYCTSVPMLPRAIWKLWLEILRLIF